MKETLKHTVWEGRIARETTRTAFFPPSQTEPLPWRRRLFLWLNHRWPRVFGVRIEEEEA